MCLAAENYCKKIIRTLNLILYTFMFANSQVCASNWNSQVCEFFIFILFLKLSLFKLLFVFYLYFVECVMEILSLYLSFVVVCLFI